MLLYLELIYHHRTHSDWLCTGLHLFPENISVDSIVNFIRNYKVNKCSGSPSVHSRCDRSLDIYSLLLLYQNNLGRSYHFK